MPELAPGRKKNMWDRQLEDGLPESRLHNPDRSTVYMFGQLWERVFCADCGVSFGGVTAGWASHTFFLCDDCCVKPIYRAAGLIEAPVPREDTWPSPFKP